MQITDNQIGRWFIYECDNDRDLAKVVAKFSKGFVVGISDTVNECWYTAIVDADGQERGPTNGRLLRLATDQEIAKDYCCGDRY